MSARTNPIADLVDDETYEKLAERGLINPNIIRNVKIRELYFQMKKETKLKSYDIIEKLRLEHCPHLEFDTLRKLIYQPIPEKSKWNSK